MDLKDLKKMYEPEDLHPDLVPYLQPGVMGQMIHHPLMISIMHHETMNKITNIQYNQKKSRIAQALQERDWTTFVFLHERPYRFKAFWEIHDEAGFWDADPTKDREFWKLVSAIWIDSENIHEHLSEWVDLWSSERDAREAVMDEDDLIGLQKLPDSFPVWRGGGHSGIDEGLSWTINKTKAIWFARRFTGSKQHAAPYLAHGIVNKVDVLAHFVGRGEAEIVVLHNNVQQLRVRKLRSKR